MPFILIHFFILEEHLVLERDRGLYQVKYKKASRYRGFRAVGKKGGK
jgi:hypothetical protein